MTKNVSTYEQSQKLVEGGLNPFSADLSYHYDGYGYSLDMTAYKSWNREIFHVYPAWTLTALMMLMPNPIQKDGVTYYWVMDRGGAGEFSFIYKNPLKEPYEVGYWLQCTSNISVVDAAVDMVYWLVKNGYIQDNKE